MNGPPYSLCACPDSFLLQRRINTLLAVSPAAGNTSWQRHVFWGDEGLAPTFWEHLTLHGLFATPKALVIRNAQLLSAETLREVSAALLSLVPKQVRKKDTRAPSPAQSSVPQSLPLIWPLLCLEVDFDKEGPKLPAHIAKLPCVTLARENGWLDVTPPLSGKTLSSFIANEASRLGLRLDSRDIALLAGALPPQAARISTEMEKLALRTGPEGRLPGPLADFVDQTRELGIFELIRAVQQNSNLPAAWRRILEDRLSGDSTVFAFIALLLREARTLWQCLGGKPPYLPPQVAAQKKLAARHLGFAGIARLWELALAADKGIKSGERSPDQAFALLAADLFVLFSDSSSNTL